MNISYSTEKFCSICYDSFEESLEHGAVRLNCQHAFGRKCIIHWALKSNKCPVCGLKTIPAELQGRESILPRLANRTIFGLTSEQKTGLLLGFFLALYVGCTVAVNYKINPDSTIGNGIAPLLLSAAGAAGCSANFTGQDPRALYFSSCALGGAIGLGLSALIISIVSTSGQS